MQVAPTVLAELPGEDLEPHTVDEVASWIAIYQELVNVLKMVLARGPESERTEELRTDLRWIEGRLSRWRARHSELAGLLIDSTDHSVTFSGRKAYLTHREAGLLSFLVEHPNRPFSCRQIAASAWNNPRLSDAQVRTYVMRLRRRLAELGLPQAIVVVGRRGYELRGPARESSDLAATS
jgi:DNA-binding response OmpR family regulator